MRNGPSKRGNRPLDQIIEDNRLWNPRWRMTAATSGIVQTFKIPMAKTPDFQRIVATITESDIDHFYRSAAPDDIKKQVRDSPDEETKKRFVAGYLIRTKQIKPG